MNLHANAKLGLAGRRELTRARVTFPSPLAQVVDHVVLGPVVVGSVGP